MLLYQDPWKDDPYGKLKGDKSQAFSRLVFEEGKFYKTDNAYIIAGKITQYTNVVRSYKPELGIMPGLCAVPIYGEEYEIRRKDDSGKWVGDKTQPSAFEQALYKRIKGEEKVWLDENINWEGQLSFVPNMMLENNTQEQIDQLIDANCLLQGMTPTGNLPAYSPPKTYRGNSSSGKTYGMSPEQKLEWFKKQIKDDTTLGAQPSTNSLIDIVDAYYQENKEREASVAITIDILGECL